MADAWVVLLGPFVFSANPAIGGLWPGTQHSWTWHVPWQWRWNEGVLSATAGPPQRPRASRLAVTMIECERFEVPSPGGFRAHFHVRNTGAQTVYVYTLRLSVVRNANLQPRLVRIEEAAMRMIAAHDEQGNIHHVVISPEDAPLATVTTETAPGLLVTEVEVPEMIAKLDPSDPEAGGQQLDQVLEQLQEFRVEVDKGKLVQKGSKGR
jgi:hypothetical protein